MNWLRIAIGAIILTITVWVLAAVIAPAPAPVPHRISGALADWVVHESSCSPSCRLTATAEGNLEAVMEVAGTDVPQQGEAVWRSDPVIVPSNVRDMHLYAFHSTDLHELIDAGGKATLTVTVSPEGDGDPLVVIQEAQLAPSSRRSLAAALPVSLAGETLLVEIALQVSAPAAWQGQATARLRDVRIVATYPPVA